MTVPVEQLAYIPTGGTAKRTLAGRAVDAFFSVKDFGAVGDGATNDTASIQACLDAAFGSWSSPHGVSNATLNIPVWFPAGDYLVRPTVSTLTITDCQAEAVTNRVRLTVASTAGLANDDMVYVRGVTGTTNANGSFSITNVDGTHLTLVSASGGVQFNAAWTGGGTVRPPCLRIKALHGGRIFGAGKSATHLFTDQQNCAVMSTNGFEYSAVEHIAFASDAGGIAFDLNCDGAQVANNQSNFFINCSFGGSASTVGDYACAIGMAQSMGSENTFLDCYVAAGTIAGLSWHNFNALAGTVIGGNIASASATPTQGGIYVVAGACPVILGVSFQNYTGTDIKIINGALDCYIIHGCRTESENFVQSPSVENMSFHIAGCNMTSSRAAGTGFFYKGGAHATIDGCQTAGGYYIDGSQVIIKNCEFIDTTYLHDSPDGTNYTYLSVEPQPQVTVTSTSYSIPSYLCGHKVKFNNANPMDATVLRNSDNSNANKAGSKLEIQQIGAGQVTVVGSSGVTIHATPGPKLRAQYSVGYLTCDGTDEWTLNGDLSS